MRFERIGLSLFGAIALLVIVVAVATIWLFLTNPVTVATAVSEGEVSPLRARSGGRAAAGARGPAEVPVTNEDPTPQDVVEQLAAAQGRRAQHARAASRPARAGEGGVGEASRIPQAVLDYLDFFIPAIEEVVAESRPHRRGDLSQRVKRSHIDVASADCGQLPRRTAALPGVSRQVHQQAAAHTSRCGRC